MNWGNLNDICREHELIILDTSILRFESNGVELKDSRFNYYSREYAKFIRNFIVNTKNAKTIENVVKEIENGLSNLNGCEAIEYKGSYQSLSCLLKRRLLEKPEYFEISLKIIDNAKESCKLSETDYLLVAYMFAYSNFNKTIGLTNDKGIWLAADRISFETKMPINLYTFNGNEFVKVTKELFKLRKYNL